MTAKLFLFTSLSLLTLQYSIAQPGKGNTKAKSTTQKELRKEAVIYSENDLKKFEEEWRQDSIRAEEEWKIQWIKDSLQLVKEANETRNTIYRVYRKKLNPKDSLNYVDEKTHELFRNTANPAIDEVINTINKNFKRPLQRARAVYYWISCNIRYDWDGLKNDSVKYNYDIEKDALQTFKTRKGVCEHFSGLYQYMASKCGVETIKITGKGKILPYVTVDKNRSNHAWNAIKIDNNWKLLDVTWASKEDSIADNFWFDTPPEKFIHTHYPEDSSLQFLKRKISIDEFAQWPVINQYFFLSKARVTIPALGFYANTTGLFQLEMKNNKNYLVEVMITKVTAKNENWLSGNEPWQRTQLNIKQDKVTNAAVYETYLPGKGAWWIKVNFYEKLNYEFMPQVEFPACMIFRAACL